MSPDVEWRIGEETERETIFNTAPVRRSRRSWIAIVVVVILGAGLGVVYRAIPEPAFRPAPTPSATPHPAPPAMPAQLFDTIHREAQALADGDRAALDSIVNIPNFERYQTLVDNFEAWGRPANAAFYSIEDYRLRADDKAWVQVRQFHTDRFVQAVRFYQLQNGQWRRVDFDPSFWSGQVETADTPHFRFTYFVEDEELIESLASVLEADYEQICRDFACQATPETCREALGRPWCSSFPSAITATLVMTNQLDQYDNLDLAATGDLTFTTQSLRLLDPFWPADREHTLRNPLAVLHFIQLAYGPRLVKELLENPPPGHALVIAVYFREYERLLKRTGSDPQTIPNEFKQLDSEDPPPLEVVWSTTTNDANGNQIYAAAFSVITYMEQEYGWAVVTRLLRALGQAKSFSEVIQDIFGVPFGEFEQRWRAWLRASPH
jgi:hypothetical protein